jgi:hypothetical protein
LTPPPVPLDERDFEHFWGPDETDKLIPAPGFLSDFILALRGTECPTVFCLWSGLWAISTLLKRETWYEWFPTPLFPNLYVVLVAPPRLCGKSTVARWASSVAEESVLHLASPLLREQKRINLLRAKASPESLSILLEPVKKNVKDEDDNYHGVVRYPQIALMLSELTTFLGKQKYNVGLIDRLTDLFDCADSDDLTISRGYKIFKETYVTLLGGTTPDKLRLSIPDEAFGGGFMSRAIVVWKDDTEREFPKPRVVAPLTTPEWKQTLAERLAWVVENAQGAYTMEPEAWKIYETWYATFHKTLRKDDNEKTKEMRVRLDSHLIKVALLIRAQRYEPGRVITTSDLQQAMKLLDSTYKHNSIATEDVGVSNYTRHYNSLIRSFRKRGKMTHRQVIQLMSPRDCDSVAACRMLDQLFLAGRIDVRLDGEERKEVTRLGREVYFWKPE